MNPIYKLAELAGAASFHIKNALGIEGKPWPLPPQDIDYEVAEEIQRIGCDAPIAAINSAKAPFSERDRELNTEYNRLLKKIAMWQKNYDEMTDESIRDGYKTQIRLHEARLDAVVEEKLNLIKEVNSEIAKARVRKSYLSDEEWDALLKESAGRDYINFFMPLPQRQPKEQAT